MVLGAGEAAVVDAQVEPPAFASARSSSSSSAPTGYQRMRSKARSSQGSRRAGVPRPPVGAPHGHRASDELVPAGSLHAVDAQVRAADAHGVLRRPRAGRVVLRRDEPVPRIDGTATGAPRYTSPRPSTRYSASNTMSRTSSVDVQPVDAADELDVPRAPRRVVAHHAHVALDRVAGRRDRPTRAGDARSDSSTTDVVERRELVFRRARGVPTTDAGVCSTGSNCTCSERIPGDELGRSERRRRVQPRAERLCSQAQIEVERHRSVLDEDGSVALRPVGDLRNVALRGAGGEDGRRRMGAPMRGAWQAAALACATSRRVATARAAPRRGRPVRSGPGHRAPTGRASSDRR